jgi:hypothetical protein
MSKQDLMYLIRDIKEGEKEGSEYFNVEYEVLVDTNIIGEIEYGPFYFTIWEFTNKGPGEERKLCLRFRQKAASDEDRLWEKATKDGYYHGGGNVDELISLASLFLRRRLKLGPIVRMYDNPRYFPKSRNWIDKALIEGQSNLGELPEWLKFVEELDSKYHLKFILAVKMYHRALQTIEEQPDMAYLNLVSAIEVLCQDTPIEDIKLSEINGRLAKLLDKISDEDLRVEIESAIIEKEWFIGRRFVAFIMNHIDDEFWNFPDRPETGRINPKDLPTLLKRIYNQRSRTLHSGESFPPQVFYTPLNGAEIDFSLGRSSGEKKWEPKDYIPYPHFFERLINYVLKNFLKKNIRPQTFA